MDSKVKPGFKAIYTGNSFSEPVLSVEVTDEDKDYYTMDTHLRDGGSFFGIRIIKSDFIEKYYNGDDWTIL